MTFSGLITALITPFRDGALDEHALAELVEWQISEGVDGIVASGTTGESPTLSHEEHIRVVKICSEQSNGRVPIIAGTGSNSTAEAVALSRAAESGGADGLLLVTPYYNRPSEDGLYQHFKFIHDSVGIPILLYNIPGRSALDLSDPFMTRLFSDMERMIGVKDATGDLARVSTLRALAGMDICQLSGEDMTALAFNAMGGQGCISVTSNIVPGQLAEMHKAWFAGEHAKALAIHERLMPLHDALFCETNPVPVKYAAHLMGKCSDDIRLPLALPSRAHKKQIKEALEALHLL